MWSGVEITALKESSDLNKCTISINYNYCKTVHYNYEFVPRFSKKKSDLVVHFSL